jgi:hypothetical protein
LYAFAAYSCAVPPTASCCTPSAVARSLSEAEISAAILYYEEHQNEIERQEIAEAEQFEEMKRL